MKEYWVFNRKGKSIRLPHLVWSIVRGFGFFRLRSYIVTRGVQK